MTRLTLMVTILIAFVVGNIRVSEAQGTFPSNIKPNLRMADQEACWKSSPLPFAQDQIKALESIQQSYISTFIPLRRELMFLRFELRHLIRDQNIPSKTLFERQRKISELQEKLETLFLSYQIKARSIFTKEQLEQLPQDCSLGMGTAFGIYIEIGTGTRKRMR